LKAEPEAENRAIVEAHVANMKECVRARTPPAVVPSPPRPLALVMTPPPPSPLVKRPLFWVGIAAGVAMVATGVALGVVYGTGTRDPIPSAGRVNAN
jgi:hypothetical protein